MNKLDSIKQNVRWKGLSHGKVPLFCVISFYLILNKHLYSNHLIVDFFYFLSFAILSGIYGYLINDLFDIDIDREHGKNNVFNNRSILKGSIIVFIILAISIIAGMRFLFTPYFLPFWATWIFLATFYSAQPFRFKEKGVIGLVINTISQYTIPIILCFSAFDSFGTLGMWGIVLFTMISGVTQEIGHQRFDMARDEKTATRTFAVRIGKDIVDRIYRFFLICDLASVIATMLLMAWNTRYVSLSITRGMIFVLPLFVYSFLCFLTMRQMLITSLDSLDPYYVEGRQDILNITYTLFPNFLLPFYLSCILFIKYPLFFVFVLFLIILTYIDHPGANLLRPMRVIYSEARNLVGK